MNDTITNGELVAWYRASRTSTIHAFAQDPDSKFHRLIPLCRPGLSASTQSSGMGPRCEQCERALKFLNATANNYLDRGIRQGRACAQAEAFAGKT